MNALDGEFVNKLSQFNSIHDRFIVSQHTSYMTQHKYTNNILSPYSYKLQWLAHIMGAKGAGNPIEFMGALSDTLNFKGIITDYCLYISGEY